MAGTRYAHGMASDNGARRLTVRGPGDRVLEVQVAGPEDGMTLVFHSGTPSGLVGLGPLAEAAAPLVRLVREFQPHVILTYDESGGYPHPDHIKTHQVAVEAFEAAADPDRYREIGGVSPLTERTRAQVAGLAAGLEAGEIRRHAGRVGFTVQEELVDDGEGLWRRQSGQHAP